MAGTIRLGHQAGHIGLPLENVTLSSHHTAVSFVAASPKRHGFYHRFKSLATEAGLADQIEYLPDWIIGGILTSLNANLAQG